VANRPPDSANGTLARRKKPGRGGQPPRPGCVMARVASDARREHALRMRNSGSRLWRFVTTSWLVCAAIGGLGCSSPDDLSDSAFVLAERPEPVDDEVWRQELERIDALIAEEREDEAIEAVAAVLEREPPASVRGALQSASAYARKQRFHRRHRPTGKKSSPPRLRRWQLCIRRRLPPSRRQLKSRCPALLSRARPSARQ
jgi:hypothetical protein